MLRQILDTYGSLGRYPTLFEVEELFECHSGDFEEFKDDIEEGLSEWFIQAEEEKEGQECIESDYCSSISLN